MEKVIEDWRNYPSIGEYYAFPQDDQKESEVRTVTISDFSPEAAKVLFSI